MTSRLSSVELRTLSSADTHACMVLSVEAGWNQIAADWTFILTAGTGFGLFREGRLIASAAVLPYRGFAWICMVLVAADARRQGYASQLLRRCMDWSAKRSLVAGLDATDAGRAVYQQLGFEDVYRITRLERPSDAGGSPALPTANTDTAFPFGLAGFDAAAFGADRTPLLASLRQRLPGTALTTICADGQLAGFLLGRDGRVATQIGPLVARDEATARELVEDALRKIPGPVFIDVPDRHAGLQDWLRGLGFEDQRGFTRMLFGRALPFDRVDSVFAIAGPELG
jgi:GNAT superfamily N-acetyltransferase